MMAGQPRSATLFTFNVGFGDCFLIRFEYAENVARHVLIDFGTAALPDNKPSHYMRKVARQIQELCDGELDIVVATHRHRDHISGFSTSKSGKGPGDIIAECAPKLVLQPWTEHPDAATDAEVSEHQKQGSMAFARALRSMDRIAVATRRFIKEEKNQLYFDPKALKALSYLGETNITNKKAVENLMHMGDKRLYLAAGDDPKTDEILPGVQVEVLGPPTLEQHPDISEQDAINQAEYWHLQASATEAGLVVNGNAEPAFPNHVNALPPWARWGKRRLQQMQMSMLMPIVRRLDRALNNTSLILLFSVGDQSMLFPGDAQWENWSYALSNQKTKDKLKTVDLYKVGHHGSLNATPKSMWDLFENRGPSDVENRLITVLSTKAGVHGHSKETAVPRETLVEELERESDLLTTGDVKLSKSSKTFYKETTIRFGN